MDQKTLNENLIKKIQEENIQEIRELIEAGADLNCISNDTKKSLLRLVTDDENTDTIEFFIQKGIEPKDFLIQAIICSKESIIEYLINKKPFDLNKLLKEIIKNKDTYTKYIYRKIIGCLINYELSEQVIEECKDDLLIPAIEQGNIDFIKKLIEKGINKNKKDRYEDIPLKVAIKIENIKIIELLIDKPINEEQKQILIENSDRLLILAINTKNTEIIRSLIDNGATINIKHLLTAIRIKNIDIIKLLIDKNKDIINEENEYKTTTPLKLAINTRNTEITKFLIDNGATINIEHLLTAIRIKNIDIIKLLIDKNKDIINEENEYKTTPLESAINTGNTEIIKFLIDNGANINLKNLITAIDEKNIDILALLICKNKNIINKENENGLTPLIYASINGYKDIVDFLIEQGADINQKNKYGYTALDLVEGLDSGKHDPKYESLRILLENKFDEKFKPSEEVSQESSLTSKDIKQNLEGVDKLFQKTGFDLSLEEIIKKYFMLREGLCDKILANLKEILGNEITEKYLNEDFDGIYEIYRQKQIKDRLKKCKDYFQREGKNNFECLIEKILTNIVQDIIKNIYFHNMYLQNKIDKLSTREYLTKHNEKYHKNFLCDLYLDDKKYNVWVPFLADLYQTDRYLEVKQLIIGNKPTHTHVQCNSNSLSTSSITIGKVIENLGLNDKVIVKDVVGKKVDKLEQISTPGKIQISVIKTYPSHVICVDSRGEKPVIYCSYFHFYQTPQNHKLLNNIYDAEFLDKNIEYFSKESFEQNNKSSTCPLIAVLYAKLLSENKTEKLQEKALNFALPAKLKYILIDSFNKDEIAGKPKKEVLKILENQPKIPVLGR